MRQSKYSISEYWTNKITQVEECFWNGLFENKPIRKESFILNPVILNSYSNQAETAWVVYPSLHSLLGFLQYIYLPTAFIGLIKGNDSDYEYYFEEELGEVLNSFKETFDENEGLLIKMEEFYYQIKSFWLEDESTCLQKLKEWTLKFNEDWVDKEGVVLSLNLFKSPEEAANFIVVSYEEGLGIDSLEDEIGLSKNEFLQLADSEIYENDFMKRKFTDILTNQLKTTF